MSIIDDLLSIIAPHYCLQCGKEGYLLCSSCSSASVNVPERCYRCHALSDDYKTCASCRSSSHLFKVIAIKTYEFPAKDLIGSLKFNGRQAAAIDMVRDMVAKLDSREYAIIMPVPTTTDRVRSRGYDQAVLLARRLSKQLHGPYANCLRRIGRKHQVGASRYVRKKQLANAFYVTRAEVIKNKHILLVDDVCTTGATLEAAALVLRTAGARRVSAIVYAQA